MQKAKKEWSVTYDVRTEQVYLLALCSLTLRDSKSKIGVDCFNALRTDTCYLFPLSRRDRGVAFNTLHIVEINVFTAEFPAAYYPEVLVWVCWQEKKWSIL